jgi:putative holliday junction resolvase
MRVVGFDVGARRTGVAVSDASGTIARPFAVLSGASQFEEAAALAERLAGDDEGLSAMVVGLPRRLDGSDNEQTPKARAFAERLAARVGLPVVLQDERLTSIEAERRLALTERDWRKRKRRIDAAAAAIILQDYLDARPRAAASSIECDGEYSTPDA